MKQKNIILSIIVAFAFISCNQTTESEKSKKQASNISETSTEIKKSTKQTEDIKPEHLTAKTFKEKVWNYEINPEQWVYKGEIPCVIDFYADWCKPCKMVAPIMDDLADYYDGRVKIYKVDTDKERELATVFQVKSIPSVLFSPKEGKPAIQAGAMSKEDYIRIIDEFILGIKKESNNSKKQS